MHLIYSKPLGKPLRAGLALAAFCLPPSVVHEALASSAATVFEAAPFVLLAGLLRVRAAQWGAALLGCGCGGSLPAGLSLPATALCWTLFGPWPALARFAASLALARFSREGVEAAAESDPLARLAAIPIPAFAVALATSLYSHERLAALPLPGLLGDALGVAAGFAAGAIAPCATTGVALAAMLRSTAPPASIGLLAGAGIVSLRLSRDRPGTPREARHALVAIAVACCALGLRHGAGFVHPRLLWLVWLAVPAALASAIVSSRTRARSRASVPLVMLAALVAGSPVPSDRAAGLAFDGAYPGERASFTGTARIDGATVSLTRAFITCCRADATVVSVATDIDPHTVAAHAWLRVRGRFVRAGARLVLAVDAREPLAPPPDPFAYR